MTDLRNILWIEFRKIYRSKLLLYCGIALTLVPLMSSLMIFIFQNPDLARKMGIISAKANLMGGTADWSTFLGVISMGLAMAGMFLFSLIESWIFGREFTEATLKDMLAVPVSRLAIVLGKFIVTMTICFLFTLEVVIFSVTAGFILKMPQVPLSLILNGLWIIILTGIMVIMANMPFAFLASVGKGYLLPLGITMLLLLLANIIAVLGWGDIFPWTIPTLLSGLGDQNTKVTAVSYVVLLITAGAGIFATYTWWVKADHQQ